MNIYVYEDYKELLQELLDQNKLANRSFTLAQLAKACDMQASYLTNVFKGRGDFNSDQVFKILEFLGSADETIDFTLLLLEYNKTVIPVRRKKLYQKIQFLRSKYNSAGQILNSKNVILTDLEMMEYYLDPFIELVHLYLGIDPSKANEEIISAKFSLSTEHSKNILSLLKKLGFINKKGNAWQITNMTKHLPKESPLCLPSILLQRQISINQIQKLGSDNTYSFSAVIGTTEKVKEAIKIDFLKFIKSLEKHIKSDGQEKLYQLNFDLFPW